MVVPRKTFFRPWTSEGLFGFKGGFDLKQKIAVVKIGTSSLTDDRGQLVQTKLHHHVDSVVRLRRAGYRVVIVSSGAIAAGFHELGLSSRPQTLAGKQAAAAVGQGALVQRYRQRLAAKGLGCGQVLLTRSDFGNRERYRNALATLNYLLEKEVVPVVNENDSVAVDEIRWGDNDTLGAQVAGLLQAEWLLLVTNTDGVYTENPLKNKHAKPISHLTQVDQSLLEQIDTGKSRFGSGGMRSKLLAARLATETGIRVYIGTAKEDVDWMVHAVQQRGSGTYIEASAVHISRKDQWIAVHSTPQGKLTVDQGAERALLEEGRSLLPCGVLEVGGEFDEGAIVEVVTVDGMAIGRGRTRYSASLIKQVKGWQTAQVRQVKADAPEEVIHRDDWVASVLGSGA